MALWGDILVMAIPNQKIYGDEGCEAVQRDYWWGKTTYKMYGNCISSWHAPLWCGWGGCVKKTPWVRFSAPPLSKKTSKLKQQQRYWEYDQKLPDAVFAAAFSDLAYSTWPMLAKSPTFSRSHICTPRHSFSLLLVNTHPIPFGIQYRSSHSILPEDGRADRAGEGWKVSTSNTGAAQAFL